MRLIIPEEILKAIERKCKPVEKRTYFAPKDLVAPLQQFIDEELKQLDRILYLRYMGYRGTDERTLRHAWASLGKENDGAIKELRNLLCYFGFKKNWDEVLKDFNFNEKAIIENTKQIKEDFQNSKNDEHSIKEVSDEIETSDMTNVNVSEINRFANRIYIELITRKAGIPIDEDNDVIEEIYNSWYKLFCVIREELKLVPAHYFKPDDSNSSVNLSLKLLNDVLRPHLTEHQAKFRSWMNNEKQNPKNTNLSPQVIQRKYPDYTNLSKSLINTNSLLIQYSKKIELIK